MNTQTMTQLRQLKLGGMAAALQTQLEQVGAYEPLPFIERLGLLPEQRVRVYSEIGELNYILVREFDDIKPGNALMYFPEANVLVPRTTDPMSKTPAFNGALIRIDASG